MINRSNCAELGQAPLLREADEEISNSDLRVYLDVVHVRLHFSKTELGNELEYELDPRLVRCDL